MDGIDGGLEAREVRFVGIAGVNYVLEVLVHSSQEDIILANDLNVLEFLARSA